MNAKDYESRVLSMVQESLNKPARERIPITSTGSTPYDEEIAKANNPDNAYSHAVRLRFLGRAEGYSLAKAEDRALLEAALAHITELHQTTGGLLSCETADRIREALTPSTSTT